MVTQEKQIVETLLFADGRAEIIEKFTRWVNELPFGHDFILRIDGVIGDEPCQDIPEHVVQ